MFLCTGCKKRKPEKARRFVGTDWCSACCDDELERTSEGSPLRSELPAYMRPK